MAPHGCSAHVYNGLPRIKAKFLSPTCKVSFLAFDLTTNPLLKLITCCVEAIHAVNYGSQVSRLRIHKQTERQTDERTNGLQ